MGPQSHSCSVTGQGPEQVLGNVLRRARAQVFTHRHPHLYTRFPPSLEQGSVTVSTRKLGGGFCMKELLEPILLLE